MTEKWEDETWEEDGIVVEIVVGHSGIYRVETNAVTGEVIRDDRPWQMVAGVS
jgi:hypothetical protein